VREYLLTLLVAAAMTYLLTPLVRKFAIAVRALPAVRDRDVHAVPTPRLGGLAMYGGLAAALLVASQLTHMKAVFAANLNTPGNLTAPAGLLLAGGLIVVTGFVDDRWGMSALSKFATQVAAAGILVWGGVELDWIPLPKGSVLSLSPRQGIALTILLVLVTINAVNFIDGLDGLAAGVVGIAAFAFFIYSYELTRVVGLPRQTLPALVSAVLAGMCLGFLPHNFYPARIFMGDTGSMLIGLVLAYATISSSANLDPATLQHVNRLPLVLLPLIPMAILTIPYTDLLLAVIRRARAGQSVFAADRGHLHHRMLNIGYSHRLTVLILYLWAGLFAFTVVSLSIVGSALAVLSVATIGGIVALLLVSLPWLRSRRPSEARRDAKAGSATRRRHAAGPRGSSQPTATATRADGFPPSRRSSAQSQTSAASPWADTLAPPTDAPPPPDGLLPPDVVIPSDGPRPANDLSPPDALLPPDVMIPFDGPRPANGLRRPDGRRSANGLRQPDGPRSANGLRQPDGPRRPDGPRSANGLRQPDGPRSANGLRQPDGPRSANGLRQPDGPRPVDGLSPPDGLRPPDVVVPRDALPGPGGAGVSLSANTSPRRGESSVSPSADIFPPLAAGQAQEAERKQRQESVHPARPAAAPVPGTDAFPQQQDDMSASDDASAPTQVNGRARPARAPKTAPRPAPIYDSGQSTGGESAAGTSGKGLTKSL